ncbi:MAG: pyridoxamine 5'-phosphate oxidase family protein [Anaerolineae bacterium]|nr:pyridoxamine 5'-phosphate oxidase family protein [Anaerolineae bacterium]MCO5193804.1 pyridoxamine 5'-phosphate oxidase family protein [Anaerolineae bacterium]
MTKDYTTLPATHMRRNDRAVIDEAWIRAMLHGAAVGTLATAHNDQPFLNSNLFVYDEAAHAIYIHTAATGRTRSNIAHNPLVCFTVFEMGRLLPASVALEFSVEYSSVVVFGRSAIVEDEKEATHALQHLLDKYAPHLTAGEDYRPPVPEELKRTAVFKITIDDWIGKRKVVAADFPGAFGYGTTPGA